MTNPIRAALEWLVELDDAHEGDRQWEPWLNAIAAAHAALAAAPPDGPAVPEGREPAAVATEAIDRTQSLPDIALKMLGTIERTKLFIPEITDTIRKALEQLSTAHPERLRHCPTHGQQPATAWGCPECVRELREQLSAAPPAPAPAGEVGERVWPPSVAAGCHEAAIREVTGSPEQQLLAAAGNTIEQLWQELHQTIPVQLAPAPAGEAAKLTAEIRHFLAGYRQMRGLDPEHIYSIHRGDAMEAHITVSGLTRIADLLEQRQAAPVAAPDDRGVLPMIVSETGADDEPELERIICASISGGADYVNNMPRELVLERITPEGSTFARYIQADADTHLDVPPAQALPLPSGDVQP